MNISTLSLDSLPLAKSANLALDQFRRLARIQGRPFSGASLLYERAFILGLSPAGPVSPNGSCHLLPCRDGMLAVNLPRAVDWESVPAWLGPWQSDSAIAMNDWHALKRDCAPWPTKDLLMQAHLLGLAVAVADELPPPPKSPAAFQNFRTSRQNISKPGGREKPLVVDLSSLWAGPLCSHLLQQAGCRVIKVEGINRLDGARAGSPDFYRLLNQGKESVILDFKSEGDIVKLRQLISHADIVIEGSRPRALQSIGIAAEKWVASRPGLVWLSITGYGRHGEDATRTGFGDDAAAAAGLSRIMYEATGEYQFAGDAIADPLTGIHSAYLAWQSYLAGGNQLISISLRDTVSYCLQQELSTDREAALASCRLWSQMGEQLDQLFPAGPRPAVLNCAEPGEDNDALFKELKSSARSFD